MLRTNQQISVDSFNRCGVRATKHQQCKAIRQSKHQHYSWQSD